MKKTRGVHRLNIGSAPGVMHPTLVVDETNVLLIDTGLPTQMTELEHELKRLGFELNQITAILITHHDMDHMGNLLKLKTRVPHIEVFAHREEIPYIDGTLTHLKIQDVETSHKVLLSDQQAWFDHLKSTFPTLVCRVDTGLEDHDVLDIAGGLEVIATPGHTLGHICLYHRLTKTLIAGDALTLNDGIISGPNPRFTHDIQQAFDSLQKLAVLDISNIILYHGDQCEGEHLENQIKAIPRPQKEDHHG